VTQYHTPKPPPPKPKISQVAKCKHYNSAALTPDAQQVNANFDALTKRMLTGYFKQKH